MTSPLTELRPDDAGAGAAGAARPARRRGRPPADGTIYHPLAAPARRPIPRSSPSGWCTGPSARPTALFMAQRDAERRLAHASPTRRRSSRCARIGAALLRARSLARAADRRSCPATTSSTRCSGSPPMYVGIPYAPISPAYSLISTDFGKLATSSTLLTPGLVFAADGAAFARAIEAAVPPDVEVVVDAQSARRRGRRRCSPNLLATAPTAAVDAAHAKVGPDTIAKIPVHLRLDRHAEGRDQHPAHVVLQPGDDAHRARLLRRTSRR